MIERTFLQQTIQQALARSRVVALVGPRQCGKTTLARHFVSPDSVNYFDLEDPVSLARLDQPMTVLSELTGLVVIDEIQRRPELLPILKVLCDRDPLPARFLVLGSAPVAGASRPGLLRQLAESLAGRIETVSMAGFSLAEVGAEAHVRHWQRGGYPLAFLAASDEDSQAWRKDFVRAFLERDLPQLGRAIPAASFFRFWSLLAHYHGQVWNAAAAARTLSVSESTTRRYLDLLERVFLVRQLAPWHANLAKRQIKSPKVYLRDTGLLHQLLGIRTEQELLLHPKSGASWEGYVVEEVIKAVAPHEAYFWGTHAGAELDLLLVKHGRRLGVECKRMDAPRLTASMQIALADLALDHLAVVYPGDRPYPLADRVTVVPLAAIASGAQALEPESMR